MAYIYGFSSSPSISFPQKTFNSTIISQSRIPQLRITQISSQDSVSEVKDSNFSQLPDVNKKKFIWVNPKSTQASKFRQNSYDSRYNSLIKVAESLNSCSPVQENVFEILDSNLGHKLVEQDGVVILNNMSNPLTAPIVLKYFQERCKLNREVVFYNVTLKVLRKSKDLNGAENLFDEMLQRGIAPDNVTFSTIIGCARLSSLPVKAVEWFEKMPEFGIQPDEVIYSVMIDCYGRIGNVEMALKLYDKSRTEKWRIDVVTFTTIIRIYGTSGNFDGCLTVFEEMKALGVKPNLVCYNTMMDAMGRAKRAWQVKTIYQQILDDGLTPGWATYASLIRAYAKARYGDDAINVYKEMKSKGFKLNNVLYNTLLSLCADIGFVDEAIEIFNDIKSSTDVQPDSWTYSSLITIFSCCGKVSEAEAMLKEMMENGFEPNIYVLTSLIQCYGKSNRTDDVVKTFDQIIDHDITPDERTCGCLLNVMTQTPVGELFKLTRCVEKANPKLGHLVKLILDGSISGDKTFKYEGYELLANVSHFKDEGKELLANVSHFKNEGKELLANMSHSEDEDDELRANVSHLKDEGKELLANMSHFKKEGNELLANMSHFKKDGNELLANVSHFKNEANELLANVSHDARKAYCNCLIDLCINLDQLSKACELLELGISLKIYNEIQSKTETNWSLHLKSLSLGAALTALHIWINDLTRALDDGDEFPPLLGINTGHGKHKYSEKGLAGVIESHLKEIGAPFHEAREKAGWFLTTKVAAKSWLESRRENHVNVN